MAWKTLKDFLEMRGNEPIYGSRDATQAAFQLGLLRDGDVWMNMIKSCNQTTHTYNEDTARQIADIIVNSYFGEFILLRQKLLDVSNKLE